MKWAYRAGVTRVTVYRHFHEKKELVREAFLRVEQVFEKGLADLKRNPHEDGEKILDQIGEGLSALPRDDAFARMDELKRLYPDVYGAVQEVRVATLNGLFEQLFAATKHDGRLRSGLNRPLVQAVFLELAINLFNNPRLKSFGLSDAELYHAMKEIFLYGILGSRRSTIKNGGPMIIKGVKPRTHLMIDFLLFALLGVVVFSAIMEHAATREGTHIQFMFHRMHGVAGIAMCLTLGLHLYTASPLDMEPIDAPVQEPGVMYGPLERRDCADGSLLCQQRRGTAKAMRCMHAHRVTRTRSTLNSTAADVRPAGSAWSHAQTVFLGK